MIIFKCKWEGWDDPTWERWDDIRDTMQFHDYCMTKAWLIHSELLATMREHTEEEFYKIISNMAIYGDVERRKALKIVIQKQFQKW